MPQARAIANNDIVYLWWTYEQRIPDCLGFAIYRIEPGGKRETVRAFAGFDGEHAIAKHEWKGTDYWPIQSYQWKDLFVPEETEVSYEIVPVKGTPGQQLEEIPGLAVQTTGTTSATDTIGHHRVVFNRGIISTQSISEHVEHGQSGKPNPNVLRSRIADRADPVRLSLAGEAPAALTTLLKRAQSDGGKCFCALYELTDPELIDAIKATAPNVELILSNADNSKDGYDGTNKDTRVDLHAALGDAAIHDRLLPENGFIGHNKFVVYVDPGGTAKAVLTGSTNWTPTGLCAQSNNALLLEDETIAARYLDYWNRLLDDTVAGAKQDEPLRTADAATPPDLGLGDPLEGAARIWYSPNTPQKHKPSGPHPPAPPDMDELADLIGEAEHGVLFLVFSPGAPSILDRISEVEKERRDAGREFFVRGAISDATKSAEFATRVYNDSSLDGPNTVITGIGGIDDPFAFWEAELAQLGHAVIHDKILVIDPFTRPIVVNGSHNLGYKASYSNDENMCIVRGNARLAESFTAHVLDIVNHYNWRTQRHPKDKQEGPAAAKPGWSGLDKSPGWQDKYFKGSFLASRDRFFFPSGG
jgi:phosphatidylserine/phosphatidylglycerophosphate/cardiolipin synthase-like enzyme